MGWAGIRVGWSMVLINSWVVWSFSCHLRLGPGWKVRILKMSDKNLKPWLSLLSCSSLVLLLFLSSAASSLLFFLFIASAKVTANCQVECQLGWKEIIEKLKAGGDDGVTCQPGRGTCHGPCQRWRRGTGARLEGSPGSIFARCSVARIVSQSKMISGYCSVSYSHTHSDWYWEVLAQIIIREIKRQ